MHTCTHTCMQPRTDMHTHAHTCAHTACTCTHTCTHVRTPTHVHARTPVHTNVWHVWGTAVSLKNLAVDETKVISCGVLGPCVSGLSPGPDFPPCHLEPDAAACERALMWEAACSRSSPCVQAFRPLPPPQTRQLPSIPSSSMLLFSETACVPSHPESRLLEVKGPHGRGEKAE